MKIIKETSRKIGTIQTYRGVCDSCGTPVEYNDELVVIEIDSTEEKYVFVPVDCLVCPECSKQIHVIYVYKSMDISGEIAGLAKGSGED